MSDRMTLDYAEVSEFSRRLKVMHQMAPQLVDQWLHKTVGPMLLKYMREEAPQASGRLVNALRQVDAPGSVAVGTRGVPYIQFVVEGTRPHDIKPRNGSVLAFKVGGRTVFAKVVHHPGTKANDFMTRAAKRAIKDSMAYLPGLGFNLKKDVK